MSYDISLVKGEKEVYNDNYTYNVSPMFRDAIGGGGLHELYDKKAVEVIPMLENAITKMKNNPEHYEVMNPSNKWGNYEGALGVLENLYKACKKNKTAIIKIT